MEATHQSPLTLRGPLAPGTAVAHAWPMTDRRDASRFRQLPEPVRQEDLVETVDAEQRPVRDEETEERERFLRQAGG